MPAARRQTALQRRRINVLLQRLFRANTSLNRRTKQKARIIVYCFQQHRLPLVHGALLPPNFAQRARQVGIHLCEIEADSDVSFFIKYQECYKVAGSHFQRPQESEAPQLNSCDELVPARRHVTTALHTTGRLPDDRPTTRAEHARPDTCLASRLVRRFAASNARLASLFRRWPHGACRCAHSNLNFAPRRVHAVVYFSVFQCRPDLSFWILVAYSHLRLLSLSFFCPK